MTSYSTVWELDSLLPHPRTDEFNAALEQFRADLQRLADRSESLPPISSDKKQVAECVAFLRDYESVIARATDLNAFIGCHAAADAQNKFFQQLEARLSSLEPLREKIATNFEFALQAAGESDLKSFLEADPYLRRIAFFIHDRRRNAALRLPREQELLAADLAVDGLHAWGRLYDRISGALRIKVMDKGEIVEKSPGQVQFDSPQRAVRENNFYAADKAWRSIADTCADAVNHIAGTRLTRYRRLGLRDHLEVPLHYNRMRRETLEAMWSTITARKPVLLGYLNKKAELLGLERLAWYDVTAPLPRMSLAENDDELSWDEACNLVINTFHGFSPELGAFAELAIRDRWIEAENRSGKRQGGFCTGFPTKKQSRIFMTFTESADSMSTLAHELGHAWHSHVLRDEPVFLQDYPMNLAETASTFAEAVLGDERLKRAKSPCQQLAILDGMLGDAVAFLMNIHCRFLFEDRFHRERAAGELTAQRLSELMLAAQQDAFCNALADDGWNPSFWISKLHFYITGIPFYNFPYTFGYLLSLGVYAAAADAGPDFPEQYRRLLLATGSQNTEEAVQSTLGYDLTDAAFWNRSLDIIERRVERFLELARS